MSRCMLYPREQSIHQLCDKKWQKRGSAGVGSNHGVEIYRFLDKESKEHIEDDFPIILE